MTAQLSGCLFRSKAHLTPTELSVRCILWDKPVHIPGGPVQPPFPWLFPPSHDRSQYGFRSERHMSTWACLDCQKPSSFSIVKSKGTTLQTDNSTMSQVLRITVRGPRIGLKCLILHLAGWFGGAGGLGRTKGTDSRSRNSGATRQKFVSQQDRIHLHSLYI
jgi:hypothetical protein